MATPKTHYERLGITRGATPAEVAVAYRDQLARLKTRHGISAVDVAALREAYQVLSTPARRAEYDKSIVSTAPAWQKSARPQGRADHRSWWQSMPFALLALPVLAGIAAWGWNQRGKASTRPAQSGIARPVAAPAAVLPPLNAKLLLGRWRCESRREGGSAEHAYGSDGRVHIVSAGGDVKPHYRVVGRTIQYDLAGQRNVMALETLTAERMVQAYRLPDGRPAADRVECRRPG